ncbi:hypothetical protein B0O99DRAFT_646369 [Bisporella sp. PMI_857]|nr:hypothetical protein B0O99DRAFT_646369 [Bisporella sp. PMI_857]
MDPYSLLPRDPATICHMRARFFNMTLLFRVTRAEYNLYWPIINNVYIFNKTRCASNAFKRAYKSTLSSRFSLRATIKKIKIQCNVKLRLVIQSEYVEFTSVDSNFFIYTHSLNKSDAYKRNSAILAYLQADITKSYALAAVISFIRNYGQSEVINRLIAATCWRSANPNALFALLNAKDHVKVQCQKAFEKPNSLNWFSDFIQVILLDDDFTAEIKAFRLAFFGLSAGETEVTYLLYRVYR